MSLRQGMPAGAGCRFRESFDSPLAVMDQGGVIVASSFPAGGGISPTGISARVTYDQTQSLLINASKMTLAVRIKAGTARATLCPLVAKCNVTVVDNQFILLVSTLNAPILYVPVTAADFATYVIATAPLVVGSEYVLHAVFDGTAALASRGILYRNGIVDPSTTFGPLPAALRASGAPLTVFNYHLSATFAPSNDYLMREAFVFDTAFSPAEVADSYASIMAQETSP
jgi:hypothetical protein